MKNLKKVVACLLFATLTVMGAMLFTSCDEAECSHVWADATCTEPKTCILCDVTEGEALGHTGGTPTCTSKALCTRCGEDYGELAAHTPAEDDGDCTTPVLCVGCDKVMVQAKLAHIPAEDDGDCSTPVLCTTCGGVVTAAKTHLFGSDCDTDCNNIGCSHTRVVTHRYTVSLPADEFIATPATCRAAATYYKSCACGAKGADTFTYGDPLAHTPKAPQQENVVNPTCGEDGSYDEVVRCLDCNEVISTEKKTIFATGNHTPGVPVRKNEVAATCGEDGSYDEVVSCTVCKNEISTTRKTISATGVHTPKAPVEEGRVEPTCGVAGSYNLVTYCRDCNHKISTELKTVAATGNHTPAEEDGDCTTAIACTTCGGIAVPAKSAHTPKEAVKENEKLPTCDKAGSYESVVYCAECNKQISRTTVSTSATGNHTAKEAVKENEKLGNCGVDGSYDNVVYCRDCNFEMSRETVTVSATGEHTHPEDDHDCTTAELCTVCGHVLTPAKQSHTPAEAVKEDIVAPGCGTDGSHKNVVYCEECGKKLSSETVTDFATGNHTPAEAVKENEVAAGCGTAGSYDSVVYCADCGHEMSRTTETIQATGNHTPAEAVKENEVAAGCGTAGSYDSVVYCADCGHEMSRTTETIQATGEHTPAEAVKENEVAADCGTAGSYESVVYCAECGHEISRTTETIQATGEHTPAEDDGDCTTAISCTVCGGVAVAGKEDHTAGDRVTENENAPTCGVAGSHDEVVYCTVCDKELSRETVTDPATGEHTPAEDDGDCTTAISCTVCGGVAVAGKEEHTPADAVKENEVAPTCGKAGSHDEVVYCTVCDKELSRETVTDPATGAHVFDKEVEAVTYLKASATCKSAAIYYKSCVCGAHDEEKSETFTVGEAVDCAFTAEVAAPEYLKSAATCQSAAIYYKTCIWCHEKGGEGDVFTDGEPKDHTFTAEVVDPKYICTVANCKEAATYYKSCESCGLKGEDTFSYGEKAACVFENELAEDLYLKEAATCEGAAVYYKSCSGCGEKGGEADTFTYGEPLPHSYTEEVVEDRYLKSAADCESAAVYYKSCACGAHDEKKSETFENGEALGHSYDDGVVTEATCTTPKSTHYTCLACSDFYDEIEGTALGHDIAGAKLVREEQLESSCEYVQIYRCDSCGEEVEGQTVTKHSHSAKVTTPATCREEGLMTYICACGDSYTAAIPANENAHNWVGVNGSTENFECDNEGSTESFECSHCDATKTVVNKSTEKEALVNKNALADSSLKLQDAEIKLDAGILGSDELKDATDLTIGATTMKKEDLLEKGVTLTEDQRAQIGESPIYDFSMKNGETVISEFKDAEGNPKTVTITIPYKIGDDENADSIFIWFINDEGGVEAIKATYNEIGEEGFVTFETSHFSYYSVTRLTEKEQCVFYDKHVETTITVEPTCTSGGYVLHICTRCGNTYKSDEVPALAHAYVKDEASSKAPTCKEFGTDFFSCKTCKHTYTVTLAKLPHSYTDTVFAPTCGKMGYTSHECSSCGSTYRDHFMAALKHDYEIEWSWNEENTEASVTFTCKHDALCTETLEARVITRHIPATCQKGGVVGAEASVYFNGKTYSDSKVETTEALPHDYAYTLYDGSYHWSACLCGARLEGSEEKHTVASEEILSAATCQKMGEKLVTCDCGFKKTESIDTVDHRFVSGTCTMCGAVDGDCDHTPSKKETLELGALGCCQESLSYTTCDCGAVKVLDMNEFMAFACMTKGEPDPDTMTGTGKKDDPICAHYVCPECGIELYMQAVMEGTPGESCYMYMSCVMTLVMNGETVLENAFAEQEEPIHRTAGMVTVNLAELGFCGGEMRLYQCADCGEYVSFAGLQPGCENPTMSEDTVVVDGVPHTIMIMSCDECGLYLEMDMYEVKINACETYYYITCTMDKGDENLYTIKQQEYDSNHEWEYVCEFEDEALGCEGGVTYTATCTLCGSKQPSDFTTYHGEVEKDFMDLGQYGCCMDELTVQKCTRCEKITYVNIWDGGCNFSQDDHVENEQGYTTHYGCQNKCGLEYTQVGVINTEKSTDCVLYFDVYHTFTKGDATVFSYIGYSTEDRHEWETTYTFKDPENPTCENGYRYESICKKCSEELSGSGSGHRHESFNENLHVDGKKCKGIRINGAHCPVCEKTHYLNVWMDCPCTSESAPYVDEKGREHDVMVRTCESCGYILTTDRYIASVEGCHIRRETVYTVTLNGEVVYTATAKQDEEDHDLRYEYTRHGESCRDGYEYVITCTRCDYRREGSGKDHEYRNEKINLSELGVACGGHIEKNVCRACGAADPVGADVWLDCNLQSQGKPSTYMGEDGYEHISETLVCENCGLTVVYDTHYEPRPDFQSECYVYGYRTTVLMLNDEEIASVTRRQEEEHHKTAYRYEYFDEALGCLGGYNRVSFCEYCGEVWGGMEMYGHDYQTETVYLDEYGACGGEVYIYRCHCGAIKNLQSNHTCRTTETPTENGYILTCDVCKYSYCFESYTQKVEGSCKTVKYCTVTVTVDGVVVLAESYEYESYEHSHEITDAALVEGSKSCTDGVILTYTCACGDSYNSLGAHHELLVTTAYDLSEYDSICGGTLYEKACPCGEKKELSHKEGKECDYEEVGCEPFVSNYVKEWQRDEYAYGYYMHLSSPVYREIPSYFYTLTCAADNCGSVIRYATYWVRDPETCMATEYILYQLGYDKESGSCQKEVILATGEITEWHDYKFPNDENFGEGRCTCACGSYVDVRNGWSECDCGEGGHTAECTSYRCTMTVTLFNTRYSDIPSYKQTVTTYDRQGNIVKQVTIYTDEEGNSHTVLTEVTYGVYTPEIELPAIFDGCGLVLKKTTTTLDGVPFRYYYENAYLEYNGQRYNLMDYTECYSEDGTPERWVKTLFEYRIGEICEYRHIYTYSDQEGHADDFWQNCCRGLTAMSLPSRSAFATASCRS